MSLTRHINAGKFVWQNILQIGKVSSKEFLFTSLRKPIKCGDVIRLQHLSTSKNLHSHHFQSPLSGNQEISCYGEEGVGDSGDHWKVVCSEDAWYRSNAVKFLHVDTDVYLSVSGRTFGR